MTNEVQVCYRHRDRRAGVRCQRCDRAICPECMRQASVGFHCPECVKQSSQKVITARTLGALSTPYLTYTLIALNVVAYLVGVLSPGGQVGGEPGFAFQLDWSLIGRGAARTASGIEMVGVADGDWYRLVTGGFLHANLLHIGFNMFALFVLGKQLEPALGRLTFGLVYFASLLAGSLGVMVSAPETLTVGASGAVFGLFGYALVAQWSRGINPMETGLGGIIIINLLFTFAVPGISIGGHLGGLIGGAAVAAIHEYVRPRINGPVWVSQVVLGVFGVACALGAIAVVA